ncbi:MAG: 4-hydroxythreonine-4-phosphate dehydrogenase PdxA, partial [Desulfurococcales archaeon]|nr:4-hydroxythreonine-4-phosphate dehydrogenase PdxA [Desulfurococcales archaeon]
AVTALNPHGGEHGLLSHGEEDRIAAAVKEARNESILVDGPLSPDTLHRWLNRYDLIIFMYHDQGSIPFKLLARGKGVNWTIGLPFVRTSVDHGTGFDIAGRGLASPSSLVEAMRFAAWAVRQAKSRRKVELPADPFADKPPDNEKTATYESLAPLYDHIMKHVDYQLWKRYLIKLFERYGVRYDYLLELATGTGRLAELLVRAKIRVVSLDRSRSMLGIARERLGKSGSPPPLVAGDMTRLPFAAKFPAVICLYDSINYLTTRDKLQECLREVRRVLEPGGHFIFDVTTEANSLRHFSRELTFEETADFCYVRRSHYDVLRKVQHNDFTIFTRRGNVFTRTYEAHRQKIYSVPEIVEAARRAGLEFVDALSGFTFEPATKRSTRIHFIFRRGQD